MPKPKNTKITFDHLSETDLLGQWMELDKGFVQDRHAGYKSYLHTFRETFTNNLTTNLSMTYTQIVNLLTKNAIAATIIMILAVGGGATAAAQFFAPEEYKPSNLLNLSKSIQEENKQSVEYKTCYSPNKTFSVEIPITKDRDNSNYWDCIHPEGENRITIMTKKMTIIFEITNATTNTNQIEEVFFEQTPFGKIFRHIGNDNDKCGPYSFLAGEYPEKTHKVTLRVLEVNLGKFCPSAEDFNDLSNQEKEDLERVIKSFQTYPANNQEKVSKIKNDEYPGWNTYHNDRYDFSLRYPDGWQVKDELTKNTAQPGYPGTGPAYFITLKKGNIELNLAVTSDKDNGNIARSGAPAGDIVSDNSITIVETTVSRNKLVMNGKTKAILYNEGQEFEVQGLDFVVSLDDFNTNYETVNIPEETQRIADKILNSITLD